MQNIQLILAQTVYFLLSMIMLRTGTSRISRSISPILTALRPSALQYKHFMSTSKSPPIGTGDRLLHLMDLMTPRPAGLFTQLFNARIALKDIFENVPKYEDKGDKTQLKYSEIKDLLKISDFVEMWVLLRCYIAGSDGLSELETNALIEEISIWDPHTTKDLYLEIADRGASLTDNELLSLCNDIRDTFSREQRNALLINSLGAARIDGLSDTERESYHKVAEYLNVSDETAREVMDVYQLEVDLKKRYSNLVMPKAQ